MSDETWSREEIESPCVKVCVIHPGAKLCVGCLRTAEEIARLVPPRPGAPARDHGRTPLPRPAAHGAGKPPLGPAEAAGAGLRRACFAAKRPAARPDGAPRHGRSSAPASARGAVRSGLPRWNGSSRGPSWQARRFAAKHVAPESGPRFAAKRPAARPAGGDGVAPRPDRETPIRDDATMGSASIWSRLNRAGER